MSFVYAIKQGEFTSILSDTKVTFNETGSLMWETETYNTITSYGLIKSVVIGNKCCIAFAGNNIALAHSLFATIYDQGEVSEEEIIDYALNIHRSANQDEIEFIICTADENDVTHIACIKNGELTRDNIVAWIGSPLAFRKFQELRVARSEKQGSSHIDVETLFDNALSSCKDDTVGGFPITIIYSPNEHGFFYTEKLYTVVERKQTVAGGECVKLSGTAEEGAYTACQHWSNKDVIIDVLQADLTILYTKKYRLTERDANNEETTHFLLPISCRTSTGQILYPHAKIQA